MYLLYSHYIPTLSIYFSLLELPNTNTFYLLYLMKLLSFNLLTNTIQLTNLIDT